MLQLLEKMSIISTPYPGSPESGTPEALNFSSPSRPKVPCILQSGSFRFGVLGIRILLFRVLCILGSSNLGNPQIVIQQEWSSLGVEKCGGPPLDRAQEGCRVS